MTMVSLLKKVVLGILGFLVLSYLFFNCVAAFNNQVLFLKNNIVTAFIVEHILTICYLMGITLFVLGLAALFKTVIYMKRDKYNRQKLRQ